MEFAKWLKEGFSTGRMGATPVVGTGIQNLGTGYGLQYRDESGREKLSGKIMAVRSLRVQNPDGTTVYHVQTPEANLQAAMDMPTAQKVLGTFYRQPA